MVLSFVYSAKMGEDTLSEQPWDVKWLFCGMLLFRFARRRQANGTFQDCRKDAKVTLYEKNSVYKRPVFLLKKFNHDVFWGIPITSKLKNGLYYYLVEHEGCKKSLFLSQLRLFSSKCFLRKIYTLSHEEYEQVCKRIRGLLPV